ncbi:MAG: hypothetical protein U0974_01860 [Gemmatimonadales bacterium]|nr:hypothetical protein [Gemmatimonadales bacterium]
MPQKSTPWGVAQTTHSYGPGITRYTTAGHGGIELSVGRNRDVHKAWRRPDGWYEEDCEANIVVFTFPQHFPADHLAYATSELKASFPHEFTAVTGQVVTIEESPVLRREQFERQTQDQFVVASAFGSPPLVGPARELPAGMVGVLARKATTQEEAWFLVPKEEYRARAKGASFVVDPSRHEVWPALPIAQLPSLAARGGR